MSGLVLRALPLLLLLTGPFTVDAATAAPGTPAGGMIGVRLLDIPTARAEDPRARTYIIDHLAPGTTIERRIEVSNTTPTYADVSVYVAAASIDQGSFTPAPGREGNDLTQWTGVEHASLDLPSNSTRIVKVTISVPRDAPAGEHYGVVWAEMRSESPGDVTVVNRVGIRIYLSVGPGGEPASALDAGSMTAGRDADGRPTVMAQVSNTGGRALDVAGELTLTGGPGGLSGGPYKTEKPLTLRPGQDGTVTFVLAQGLPAGPWTAHLEVTSGTTTASTDSRVTFPAIAEALNPSQPSQGSDLWYLTALLAAAAITVIILMLILVRRRRNFKA